MDSPLSSLSRCWIAFRAFDETNFHSTNCSCGELQLRVRVWRAGALELIPPYERSTELGKDRDAGIDLGQ